MMEVRQLFRHVLGEFLTGIYLRCKQQYLGEIIFCDFTIEYKEAVSPFESFLRTLAAVANGAHFLVFHNPGFG